MARKQTGRKQLLRVWRGSADCALDLSAKQSGETLCHYLGGHENRIPAYASGLDFHLTDKQFTDLFGAAANEGFTTFKIKEGHEDPDRDLHRLSLLRAAVGDDAGIMVDAFAYLPDAPGIGFSLSEDVRLNWSQSEPL